MRGCSRWNGLRAIPTFKKKKLCGPCHDLTDVVNQARDAIVDKKKAWDKVAQRLGVSDREAKAFVCEKIAGLTADDYFESVEMEWGQAVRADVYGVTDDHGGWYIKFTRQGGDTRVCSCHQPEYQMILPGGGKIEGAK